MPQIPLGVSSYSRSDKTIPEVELINLFLEQNAQLNDQVIRLQRPGLTAITTLPGKINGIFFQDGVLDDKTYITSDNKFYSLTGNAATQLCDLTESGTTAFAANFERLAMVTSSGFYLFDGYVMNQVTVPDGHVPVDVASLNGYFIVACRSGRFYWVVPGEYHIDALNYATAESSPDKMIAVKRLRDELFFFGTDSVECWQPSGDFDLPFTRSAGRTYDKGCIARDSIQAFDNSLLWIGRDSVLYKAGNTPERMSDFGIEERLRTRTGNPSAWTYSLDGHLFYVLRIPGQGTFAYDASTKCWSEFRSESNPQKFWYPQIGLQIGQDIICGSSETGELWYLDRDKYVDEEVDGDQSIRRIVTGSIVFTNSKPIRTPNISLSAGSTGDATIFVRWKDGADNYPDTYHTLDLQAHLDVMTLWRCGQARQPIRTFQFTILADEKVAIYDANYGEGYTR